MPANIYIIIMHYNNRYRSKSNNPPVYLLTSSSSSMSKCVEDIQGVGLVYGLQSQDPGPVYTYTCITVSS